MNLHEELENYLRSKHPTGTNFKQICETFGENLVPSISSSTVKRWCIGTHVPKRHYIPQILNTTGIDFSRCDKRKVHGIPVKTVRAAKKAVETRVPVDFQDLQWVWSETPCVGCFIDGGSDECENVVRAITGMKCKSRNFVLKRKPTWEVCTKQNTKVGDVVRTKTQKYSAEVKYILDNKKDEMVVRYYTGAEITTLLCDWEVEI